MPLGHVVTLAGVGTWGGGHGGRRHEGEGRGG